MSDVQYDNVASSTYATVSRDGGISRAQLTVAQSGDITYDTVASSTYATITGTDGKKHRALLTVNLGGILSHKTMPTADKTNEGNIVQYVGETTADYTKGYFYESYQSGTAPSVATIEQTVGTGLEDLAVDKDTFETQITEAGSYDFIARLNREHIIATIDTDSVRMDRDESHDVEGAVAWTPDGETYFYTEELVPDVADEVFADPDGETVAGTVAEYNAESMGWEFNGEFVDISDYGITYTPADPTATVEYSSEALGTVTVDADTFATQVIESDKYIFDAVVTPERILATVDEAMIQYNRDADDDDADLFAWKDEHNVVVFTESATPTATDSVYSDTEKTPLGTVEAYSASSTKWYRGSDEITLATYGITITGTAEDGNSIHIDFVGVPPEQDDTIVVEYAEAYPTYAWRRINVQPGGSVNTVNDIEPDENGNVELSAENIDAVVGGTTDSVQDHLDSLRNDLGDLADDVAEKTKKNVITLTGESGTLTSAQIAQVLDDTEVLEIVCDGQVFRLSNKDSTLTYRTYLNEDCALNENVAFKAIYVQLNPEAANYGAWSLEEVSAGGGSSYTAGTGIDITGGVISVKDPALKNTADQPTSSLLLTSSNNVKVTNVDTIAIGNGYNATVSGDDNCFIGSILNVTGTKNTAIGMSAYPSNASLTGTVVIGAYANTSANDGIAIGSEVTGGNASVTIGKNRELRNGSNGVFIGKCTSGVSTGNNNTVIGDNAKSNGNYGIALGNNCSCGTNMFRVAIGDKSSDNYIISYTMLETGGFIPAARHASLPTADGTYVLKLVITDGVPTLSWVAE